MHKDLSQEKGGGGRRKREEKKYVKTLVLA
jgi:hypothetical protein